MPIPGAVQRPTKLAGDPACTRNAELWCARRPGLAAESTALGFCEEVPFQLFALEQDELHVVSLGRAEAGISEDRDQHCAEFWDHGLPVDQRELAERHEHMTHELVQRPRTQAISFSVDLAAHIIQQPHRSTADQVCERWRTLVDAEPGHQFAHKRRQGIEIDLDGRTAGHDGCSWGIMRTKNLRQAADALGLSHPTIRRRLNALESELGLRLFERRADGMHATPEAAELLDVAEQMETLAHTFDRRARGQSPDLKGRIEISAPDVLVSELLMPTFAALIDKWPDLHLHVAPSAQIADLARREADIAVRVVPHGSSPDDELTGRKAATIYTAVYGEDHQWIGYFGDERDQGWIKSERFEDTPVACSMANTYAVWAACLEGLGLAERLARAFDSRVLASGVSTKPGCPHIMVAQARPRWSRAATIK